MTADNTQNHPSRAISDKEVTMVKTLCNRSDRSRRLPGAGRAGARVQWLPRQLHDEQRLRDLPPEQQRAVQRPQGLQRLGRDRPRRRRPRPHRAGQLPYGSVCARLPHGQLRAQQGDAGPPCPPTQRRRRVGAASPSATTSPQALGNAPFSEIDIGCSSCHYGAIVAGNGSLAEDGNDPNDTAHMAALGNLANADICGACHSRFAYTHADHLPR